MACMTRWARLSILAVPVVLSTWAVSAEDEKWTNKVVECGSDKVVIFDRPLSPDRRYAVGWTLKTNKPDVKPVDWSKWKADSDFLEAYDFFIPQIVGTGIAPLVDAAKELPRPIKEDWKSGAPYELSDAVVDLKKKRVLFLRSLWPYWPGKNHGELSVTWHGNRALIVNEARFFTANMWLVNFEGEKMKKIDLLGPLNGAVYKIMAEKRPLTWRAYAISWLPDEESKEGILFSGATVKLSFHANIPKSDYEPVNGIITADLTTGKVVASESNVPRDDPMLDNPELAKAHAALEKVYQELLSRLDKDAGQALVEEQDHWKLNRDYGSTLDAGSWLSAGVLVFQGEHLSSVPDSGEEDLEAFAKKRDASLIQSTQARAEELKKRLQAK